MKKILATGIIALSLLTSQTIVKANTNSGIVAGTTAYLVEVATSGDYTLIEENEPDLVEESYCEPDIPTCWQKYSCDRFKTLGRVQYGEYTYTWYSQRVLPGGGLNIPGRHLNEHGLVADENEYVVLASDDFFKGAILNTPIGIKGKVYDAGSGVGNLDIYCDW